MAKQTISDADKLHAALSYLFILALIPYVFGHNNTFVKKHAKQGMILLGIELVLMIMPIIPIIGWIIFPIGWLFVLVCSVLGIAHAFAGKEFELPLVNRFVK